MGRWFVSAHIYDDERDVYSQSGTLTEAVDAAIGISGVMRDLPTRFLENIITFCDDIHSHMNEDQNKGTIKHYYLFFSSIPVNESVVNIMVGWVRWPATRRTHEAYMFVHHVEENTPNRMIIGDHEHFLTISYSIIGACSVSHYDKVFIDSGIRKGVNSILIGKSHENNPVSLEILGVAGPGSYRACGTRRIKADYENAANTGPFSDTFYISMFPVLYATDDAIQVKVTNPRKDHCWGNFDLIF